MFRALLVFGVLVGTSFAQGSKVTIEGKVIDGSGASLPGAPIVVIDLHSLDVERARTSKDGEFKFDLPAGHNYELFATYQCLATVKKTFRTDKSRKIRIQLKASNCGDFT
jgi:hypothetical protein